MVQRFFPVLVAFAAIFALQGCGGGRGEDCRSAADCASGLVCFVPEEERGRGAQGESLDLSSYLAPQTCVADADLESARGRAEADARCGALESCRESGQCTAVGESCRAESDEDCRRAMVACLVDGRCAARDGSCTALSPDDCRTSEGCEQQGRCTLAAGECRIGSDADCRGSEIACAYGGRCTFREGECIATEARDCRESRGCAWSGKCSLREGGCFAATDDDCRGSGDCREWLQCTARDGECVFAPDLSALQEASPEADASP